MKNGDIVRDTITGFTGVMVCDSTWLNGCRRITIQPQELKDGRPIESCTFDVEQIEVIEDRPAKDQPPHGGPKPEPTRN
jgi:hypothetical protein